MASDREPEEALTKEELEQDELPPPKKLKVNAFTTLMTPKPKAPPLPQTPRIPKFGRMGLGAYTADPESFPPSVVIYHNEDFVVIHDKFPKATVHTLLLPRSLKHTLQHPFEAFQDPEFLAKVQAEVVKLRKLVAKELQRRIGSHSAAEARREEAEEVRLAGLVSGLGDEKGKGKGTEASGDENDDAPSTQITGPLGRDWEAEIISGVHAVPSMSHLHIHVLSRDMHSPSMKHRKHFNSFQTPFLVPVEEFPLDKGDLRWDTRKEKYLQWELRCWRCGKGFGNRFVDLKQHLEGEFETWKKE